MLPWVLWQQDSQFFGSFKIFCKFVGCADVFVLVAEARVDVLHLRCAMAGLRLGYEVFAIRQIGVCATSKDAPFGALVKILCDSIVR